MPEPEFSLPKCVPTPGAAQALKTAAKSPADILSHHAHRVAAISLKRTVGRMFSGSNRDGWYRGVGRVTASQGQRSGWCRAPFTLLGTTKRESGREDARKIAFRHGENVE